MPFIVKNKSYSLLTIFFIGIFCVCSCHFFVHWGLDNHPFKNDINQYYSYLNALFIEHDLTFKNNLNGYWLIETPTHHFVPKVTYGMAFFYSPFYLLAKLFSGVNYTGYEAVYTWMIHFGCIAYILTGLWFTRKTLLVWFNETVTSIVMLSLFFGTNLFYYTVSESESVHGILFFLISFFLYHVMKWYRFGSKKNFLVFSLVAGFICLIRPTECLVLVFPLLIGVLTFKDFKVKFQNIAKSKLLFFGGLILFILPLFPQMLYWKMQSGSYLFFSYGNSEGFFWKDPQIINVFFSYRKGFFVYTPIMIFSICGFIFLYKKNKELFYPILLYFLLNSYLICTWWDWAFGGSFGMRALVQVLAVLIIPFACFIQWIFEKNTTILLKLSTYLIISFFCFLNVFQSNLYKHGIINYDGMTKEAYWFTFLKKTYSKDDLLYLETLVKHPNYDAMKQGKRDE